MSRLSTALKQAGNKYSVCVYRACPRIDGKVIHCINCAMSYNFQDQREQILEDISHVTFTDSSE